MNGKDTASDRNKSAAPESPQDDFPMKVKVRGLWEDLQKDGYC